MSATNTINSLSNQTPAEFYAKLAASRALAFGSKKPSPAKEPTTPLTKQGVANKSNPARDERERWDQKQRIADKKAAKAAAKAAEQRKLSDSESDDDRPLIPRVTPVVPSKGKSSKNNKPSPHKAAPKDASKDAPRASPKAAPKDASKSRAQKLQDLRSSIAKPNAVLDTKELAHMQQILRDMGITTPENLGGDLRALYDLLQDIDMNKEEVARVVGAFVKVQTFNRSYHPDSHDSKFAENLHNMLINCAVFLNTGNTTKTLDFMGAAFNTGVARDMKEDADANALFAATQLAEIGPPGQPPRCELLPLPPVAQVAPVAKVAIEGGTPNGKKKVNWSRKPVPSSKATSKAASNAASKAAPKKGKRAHTMQVTTIESIVAMWCLVMEFLSGLDYDTFFSLMSFKTVYEIDGVMTPGETNPRTYMVCQMTVDGEPCLIRSTGLVVSSKLSAKQLFGLLAGKWYLMPHHPEAMSDAYVCMNGAMNADKSPPLPIDDPAFGPDSVFGAWRTYFANADPKNQTVLELLSTLRALHHEGINNEFLDATLDTIQDTNALETCSYTDKMTVLPLFQEAIDAAIESLPNDLD